MLTNTVSSSVAPTSSTIRRRSNTNSPQLDPPSVDIQVEDVDAVDGSSPTVLLVRPRHGLGITSVGLSERSGSVVLPFASQQFRRVYRLETPTENDHLAPSPSPLAKQCESLTRMSSSCLVPQSAAPFSGTSNGTARCGSLLSLLPVAADVLSPRSPRSSLLPVFSAHRADTSPSPSRSPSPHASPLPSTRSSSRLLSSPYINISPAASSPPAPGFCLVSSLSTADKFTRKFPVHRRSMRNISLAATNRCMKGKGGAAFAGTLLGEGEGLGIEWPDRWTKHKWFLLISVCTIFMYGLGGAVFAVLTWFQTWIYSDVMFVADYDILVLITVSSAILLLTFLIGITGTILNSRPILAIYALLLWPAFASILTIGYTSYKRSTFALDRKLNFAWSQWYTSLDRLIIQNALHCCGFYNSMHEVTASKTCYVRTSLPGCKAKLWAFEKMNLDKIWFLVFGVVVPLHVANIFVAMCCANHVTVRFGKGIMPKRYWLKGEDVKRDAERILGSIGAVARPGVVRASSSGVFREDKAEVSSVLEDESCTIYGHSERL